MNLLVIFVEGVSDTRFFEAVINPLLENKYKINYFEYSQKLDSKVNKYINTLKNMGIPYFFVKDFDRSNSIEQRKQMVLSRYPECELKWIQIVKVEIESWYAAGINCSVQKKLRIKQISDCNNLCKEEFYLKLSSKQDTIFQLKEILLKYDLNLAKTKNKTLKYLVDKLIFELNT